MKNRTIFQTLYATQGPLNASQLLLALVEVTANSARANRPFKALTCATYVSSKATEAALQAAADELLSLPRIRRYETLRTTFDSASDDRTFALPWMLGEASAQILKLIGSASTVNFSHPWTMRPCLEFALAASENSTQATIGFSSGDAQAIDLMGQLTQILDLEPLITTDLSWSWERDTVSTAEIQVMIPPMGITISEHAPIPERTLASLGLHRDKIGRLTAETLCLADAMAMVPGKAIIATSQGPLFRMVGTELMSRESLIEGGRLSAILDLPPRLMFETIAIETSLLILGGDNQKQAHVRMVDLKHPDVSTRGHRGRYETLPDIDWADLITRAPSEKSSLLRDVPHSEIRDNKFVLVPSRYLAMSTKAALADFLATTEQQPLDTLVEFIRPLSIRADEEGEYTLLESMPADCGADGILERPTRAVRVDQAKYNQARNLRLIAGDIVLSVKGTIGAVAIVPDDAPQAGETTIWTVGQSMMVLRPRSPTTSSVALYEYLSNDVIQKHIKSLAFGSTLQSIAMKDLKDLPIAVPDRATISTLIDGRSKQAEIRQQINDLQAQIELERRSIWPHHTLKLPSN